MSQRSSSRAGAVIAAAVAALALSAASAGAAPAPSATASAATVAAESELTLSIVPENPTPDNPRSIVALDCGPAGGNHPDPAYACEILAEADGVFEDIRPGTGGCPDVWEPVTITATGTWQGRVVDYGEVITNRMCAALETNDVFAF
ncbi:SSI family serine proteinase inhibitor [Streptomyces sp. 4N509B]|uniref:SSI family serine proteinase inhibitor n=1 Tax=Streptomyces sp. 4N509B TaxID=3457413 RepID=UPI003FD47C03